jgi:single-stranded-DNA-specific exonuclease
MSIGLKPILERPPMTDSQVHPHPLINRILQNRGIQSMDEMKYPLKALINPSEMLNMQAAVELLEEHIRRGSRIVVVGDFDCDGATSTSIAVEGLELLGAKDVKYLIPDRMIHGYGLSPPVAKLAGELAPDLIVTVDNGIASHEGAEAVRNLGNDRVLEDGTVIPGHPCDLLITDHHLPSDKGLPKHANVIVNPSQPDCTFPSPSIAGCGVMFYVIMALRAHLRDKGFFAEQGKEVPNIATLLDLVALGTVADVVALDRNNRILIHAGLRRIRDGLARPGIKALLQIGKRDPAKTVASDMGFAVGPRINAAGRLDDMTVGIQCLLSKDEVYANEIASRLNDLNLQRRNIEQHHVFDAGVLIDEHKLLERMGVVLFNSSWHAGVVGIVASRIKEKINRPIICMTDSAGAAEERSKLDKLVLENGSASEIDAQREILMNKDAKGSCRSVPGVHLKHILDKINKMHPEILGKFGGHAMAAGLSVPLKYVDRFSEIFNEEVAKVLTQEQIIGTLSVDLKNVSPEHLTMDLCEQIQALGPWGQHFPEPEFHARFKMVRNEKRKSPSVLQDKHLKMLVEFEGYPGIQFPSICFNCVEDAQLPVGDTFEGTFGLSINEFPAGRFTLQIQFSALQDPDLALRLEQAAEAKRQLEMKSARTKGLPNQDLKNPVGRFRAEFGSTLAMLDETVAAPKNLQQSSEPAPF